MVSSPSSYEQKYFLDPKLRGTNFEHKGGIFLKGGLGMLKGDFMLSLVFICSRYIFYPIFPPDERIFREVVKFSHFGAF